MEAKPPHAVSSEAVIEVRANRRVELFLGLLLLTLYVTDLVLGCVVFFSPDFDKGTHRVDEARAFFGLCVFTVALTAWFCTTQSGKLITRGLIECMKSRETRRILTIGGKLLLAFLAILAIVIPASRYVVRDPTPSRESMLRGAELALNLP